MLSSAVSYTHLDVYKRQPWDWSQSGTAEFNCFVCHWPQPNNAARQAALAEGRFGDAVTASLVGSGIVEARGSGGVGEQGEWAYNQDAFDEVGNLRPAYVLVQDPTVSNCGGCHGVTHNDQNTPVSFDTLGLAQWTTLTTGQVMSPQRISAGGLNISGKTELGRSWDVHMERVLDCTDCHYSLNNPVYYRETSGEMCIRDSPTPRRRQGRRRTWCWQNPASGADHRRSYTSRPRLSLIHI